MLLLLVTGIVSSEAKYIWRLARQHQHSEGGQEEEEHQASQPHHQVVTAWGQHYTTKIVKHSKSPSSQACDTVGILQHASWGTAGESRGQN